MGKTCSNCSELKELTEFKKVYNSEDGYSLICKDCIDKKKGIDDFGRRCTKCGNYKLYEYFNKRKSERSGYNIWCKECVNKSRKNSAKSDSLKNSLRTLNCSVDLYESMKEKCNNRCFICKLPSKTKRLSIDHCHDTGKIRGLLCNKCNSGLGFFNDNIQNLENAIKYLEDNN